MLQMASQLLMYKGYLKAPVFLIFATDNHYNCLFVAKRIETVDNTLNLLSRKLLAGLSGEKQHGL